MKFSIPETQKQRTERRMNEEVNCQICQQEFRSEKFYCQESNTVHCVKCKSLLAVECIVTDGSVEYQKVCDRSKAGEFWIEVVERGNRAAEFQFTVRRDVSEIKDMLGRIVWRKSPANELMAAKT